MKRYRDTAMVVDGDETVGFLIEDTGNKPYNPREANECFFITVDEFNSLVQRNEMQYLCWFRDSVVASYTDEEIVHLEKLGIQPDLIEDTQKNYFERNARFDARHVALAYDDHNEFVAGCTGEVASMLGIKAVRLIFTGVQSKMSKFYDELVNVNPALKKTAHYNSTFMEITLPLGVCTKIFSATTIHPLFSTDTLQRYRGLDRGKVGLFTKSMLNSPVVEAAVSMFDSLTNAYAFNSNLAFSELAEHADEWNVLSEVKDILKAVSGGQESSEQPQRMEI